MHHTIELSVPTEATDALLAQLEGNENVVGLSVQRGASIKPRGDVISVHVLNKGGDDVLALLPQAARHGSASAVTAESAAIIDPEHRDTVMNDVDEGLWEEMEAGLRHHGRVTTNFLCLMALGGATAAIGLVEDPTPQAIAFIASAMLASGYEPLAKVPLGALMGQWDVVRRGLKAALCGYAALIAGAAVTFAILMALGETSAVHLARNPEVRTLSHPDARAVGFSIIGGLAGMIIIAAYRRSVIAGPLLLLAIIPAAALMGAALASRQWGLFFQGAERLALDVIIIWVTGALVVWFKQRTAHRKRPRALV
jgi:uncharacterized membrane protein